MFSRIRHDRDEDQPDDSQNSCQTKMERCIPNKWFRDVVLLCSDFDRGDNCRRGGGGNSKRIWLKLINHTYANQHRRTLGLSPTTIWLVSVPKVRVNMISTHDVAAANMLIPAVVSSSWFSCAWNRWVCVLSWTSWAYNQQVNLAKYRYIGPEKIGMRYRLSTIA